MKLKMIVFAPNGIREMDPVGLSKLVEEASRAVSDYRIDLQVDLGGELIFRNEDYDFFNQLNESNKRCDQVIGMIQRYEGGAWVNFKETKIKMRDALWDYHKCEVRYTLLSDDRYVKFDDAQDKEYNALDLVKERLNFKHDAIDANLVNAVQVFKVLSSMLADIYGSMEIKSDFFGWNPDDVSYTLGNNLKLRNLNLVQKSDIIRRNLTGYTKATVLKTTPKELVENLCALFNMLYRITDEGVFRIEHVSWWDRGVGLDLTDPAYAGRVMHTEQAQYDTKTYCKREKFTSAQNTVQVGATILTDGSGTTSDITIPINYKEMDGVPIEYDNLCAEGLNEGKEKAINVSYITNILLHSAEGTADDSVSMEGVFIVALQDNPDPVDKKYVIESDARVYPVIPPPQPDPIPNNVLGWPLLHVNFWKDDRVFKQGYMNEQLTTFLSTKKSMIQKGVVIISCAGLQIDYFKKVRTILGDGVINKCHYAYGNERIEMELGYEVPITTSITTPMANDDSYFGFLNTPIDTAASGYDTLLDNDTGIGLYCYAETKETLFGGTVQIFSDGNFVYTPPTGFYGQDSFKYTVLNTFNNVAIGNVLIGIRPANVYVKQLDETFPLYVGSVINSYAVWYLDALGSQPLNVSGMGIEVQWTKFPAVPQTPFLGKGFQTLFNEEVNSIPPGEQAMIVPGSGYTII